MTWDRKAWERVVNTKAVLFALSERGFALRAKQQQESEWNWFFYMKKKTICSRAVKFASISFETFQFTVKNLQMQQRKGEIKTEMFLKAKNNCFKSYSSYFRLLFFPNSWQCIKGSKLNQWLYRSLLYSVEHQLFVMHSLNKKETYREQRTSTVIGIM